jgi:hypothetical protein
MGIRRLLQYCQHSHLLKEKRIFSIYRQKENLKTVSVHYKNTDLILKMIKKANIFRVRVPLRNVNICQKKRFGKH